MSMQAITGGYAAPMAGILRAIEKNPRASDRRTLTELLITGAEFYEKGRSAGYQDGYEAGLAAGREDDEEEETDAE